MTKTPEDIARDLLSRSCFDAGERCPSNNGCGCRSDIAAALRSYADDRLELAATLADDYDGDGISPGAGYHAKLGDAWKTKREIAALVRSLKSESKETPVS